MHTVTAVVCNSQDGSRLTAVVSHTIQHQGSKSVVAPEVLGRFYIITFATIAPSNTSQIILSIH
jgi:hypothetical protein